MDTNDIPKGWWLNVTLMARKENPSWIVGVMREGKTSWITEHVKGDLESSIEAYKVGMAFIRGWRVKRGLEDEPPKLVFHKWELAVKQGNLN
tara:strand:+ start:1072 stop:1347 length:276 start_codon:yes stop_codon:yes gene_type:complete